MAKHFIQSVKLKNYRGFASLELPRMRRILLVGGLNGSGKSTFLEAIFTILDQNNAAAITRPLQWRGLPLTANATKVAVLHNDTDTKPAQISAVTRLGTLDMSFTWELQPATIGTVVPIAGPENTVGHGFTIVGTLDGKRTIAFHVKESGTDSIQVAAEATLHPAAMPVSVMLSRRTMDYAVDLANRFSAAVTAKRKKLAIELAQTLEPRVEDLSLLQAGGSSVLYATLQGETMIPAPFLGDGATALLNVGLAILQSENGVVLLDELDAAIHYSQLTRVWVKLINLARELNVQIIAATHSWEAIRAVTAAVSQVGDHQDLQYIRLERADESSKAISYTYDELASAVSGDWEVR
jgi:predicted ATPase